MADTLQKIDNIPAEIALSNGELEQLQKDTSTSVLRAFYADYGVFWQITRIIKWEKTNPSSLIETLEATRSQFKSLNLPEASNDEQYQKAA